MNFREELPLALSDTEMSRQTREIEPLVAFSAPALVSLFMANGNAPFKASNRHSKQSADIRPNCPRIEVRIVVPACL